MAIKEQSDWWALAAHTVPQLEAYAEGFGLMFNTAMADDAMKEKNWHRLLGMFNVLWFRLPDNSTIRHGPFFNLCDLCSEAWVFEEGDDG